jgi:pyruvate,water dikinase
MMAPVDLRLATDESVFGGKSVQLGESLRAGLPVPPGWGLSVDYVEAIVQGDKAALGTLENFLRDKSGPLAVRSSGVGEDAAIASFAGQHFTELNRIGYTDVVLAIHLVWNSGTVARRHGLSREARHSRGSRVAVTLQKMVFPDCAGVMFTRHPVTGADEIVIEASWGLGEAIVEGLVIPDNFRLAKDGTLREKTAGTKDVFMCALPGGGIEEMHVDDPDRISVSASTTRSCARSWRSACSARSISVRDATSSGPSTRTSSTCCSAARSPRAPKLDARARGPGHLRDAGAPGIHDDRRGAPRNRRRVPPHADRAHALARQQLPPREYRCPRPGGTARRPAGAIARHCGSASSSSGWAASCPSCGAPSKRWWRAGCSWRSAAR